MRNIKLPSGICQRNLLYRSAQADELVLPNGSPITLSKPNRLTAYIVCRCGTVQRRMEHSVCPHLQLLPL